MENTANFNAPPKYAILTRDMEERCIFDSANVYGPYDTFTEAVDACLSIFWEEHHDPNPGTVEERLDQPLVEYWDGEPDGHKEIGVYNGDELQIWDAWYDSRLETFLLHDHDAVSIYQVEGISK